MTIFRQIHPQVQWAPACTVCDESSWKRFLDIGFPLLRAAPCLEDCAEGVRGILSKATTWGKHRAKSNLVFALLTISTEAMHDMHGTVTRDEKGRKIAWCTILVDEIAKKTARRCCTQARTKATSQPTPVSGGRAVLNL